MGADYRKEVHAPPHPTASTRQRAWRRDNVATRRMTVARFDGEGVDVQTQALACFRRLRDFVQGMGQRIDAASYLVVEMNGRDSLESVMHARSLVFGDRRPRVVSNRYACLPPGELVRVTVNLDTAQRNPDGRLAPAGISRSS